MAGTTQPAGVKPKEQEILQAVRRYHFLTVVQVTRLLFSKGSHRWAGKYLSSLTKRGYLLQKPIPTDRNGKPPSVYMIARKGKQYLEAQGIETPFRLRPSETTDVRLLFLSHTLAVNSFVIAAERLSTTHPTLALAELRHERDLKRLPSLVPLPSGEKATVVPDAWLDFQQHFSDQPSRRWCVALELDRGTEAVSRWRKKVQALLAWAKGPYQERFGTQILTIAVAVHAQRNQERRLLALRRWTEAELKASGLEGTPEADLFRFTATDFDDLTTTPEDLFFGKTWYKPFANTTFPLLDGVK